MILPFFYIGCIGILLHPFMVKIPLCFLNNNYSLTFENSYKTISTFLSKSIMSTWSICMRSRNIFNEFLKIIEETSLRIVYRRGDMDVNVYQNTLYYRLQPAITFALIKHAQINSSQNQYPANLYKTQAR